MRLCIGKFLPLLLLHYLVKVENTATISLNYYKFDTYGKLIDGSACDGWWDLDWDCDTYFYIQYKTCYTSFSDCESYTTKYYYSGGNSATPNQVYDFTTTNSFSGRLMIRVEGWDEDLFGGRSHVGTAVWKLTSGTPSTWYTNKYTLESGGYFTIKYKVTCNSNYYGSKCNDYCLTRNDNWNGHYTCSSSGGKICNSGWTGTNCKYDLNECTSGSHACSSVSQNCINVGNGGGYICSCRTGYVKSGSSCVDYDECYHNTDGCAHYCANSLGSFQCSCFIGYYQPSSNDKCCYDVNECSTNNGGCGYSCKNTAGSFYCTCKVGYFLGSNGKTCYDNNECSTSSHGCNHYCNNTAGSYYCACNSGYKVSSNGKTCVDINECTFNTDNCAQICRNTAGSFTCSCNTGYVLSDGRYCNDVNECAIGNGGCAHTCTNNAGSFVCGCNTGYYLATNGKSCLDTNECASNNGGCGHDCTNTVGSYSCSCRSGYYLSSNLHGCSDISECSTDSHGCDHYCRNSANWYSCHCSTGYMLASDGTTCEDINECNKMPDVCSQQCTNSVGSYTCRCSSGYKLDSDNKTCNDIDECTENTTLCPSPKKCVNVPGAYKCNCLPGYQKLQIPERCVDIDECTVGTDLCEQTCTNTVGSYDCSCNTKYYLAGNYSCQTVVFTVSISVHGYGSSYAQFHASIQFDPTTHNVSVTNQIHAVDLSFGNGKYEVNSPTSSNYPISSGLKPYRLYRFYVTTAGTLYSADSNYYTLRTATSTPSAPPENVRVTASTSNSLRIEWAAPPSQDRNGIITGYTLQYKKTIASSYTAFSRITTTLANLTSLNEFTEYQVRVVAATSSGIGSFSDIVVTTTYEAEPVSPPQIAVTSVGADCINISLSPPAVGRINGEITKYQVVYYGESIKQTVKTIDIQPITNSLNSVNYRLTQLEENVVYHIKSSIWTRIGSGPYSVETIQKTLPSAPSGAPSNLVFISIQITSLSLNWDPPPIREQNSDMIAYRVKYYGNNVDTSVRNVTTPNTNVVLSGLKEGVVYTVVVCSYNSEGYGPCEAMEQQTLEDLPTGYPQSVNAIALHDTGIRIFWNALLGDEANGVILRYEVSVNGTQHDTQTHLYSTNETIISVNNLEEFEWYLVQVRTINSIGAGPYSNTVEVRTHQDAPSGAPRHLQGIAKNDSILLTWRAPLAADINGEITTFEVHYAGTLEDRSNRTVMVGNVTQYNLQQLKVDETYLIQVRAYTSVGPGPYSIWIAIRTLEDAPTSPPTDITTIAHSSTAIEVLWKPPIKHGQNGVITGYDIELTAVSSSYIATQSVAGNIDQYAFTNLKPHRSYSVLVAAKTQAGIGPFSVPITEQTMQDIPDLAPSSSHIRNVTARTVTIGWTPVSDDAINGILRHYELIISSSSSTLKVEPELTSYTLLGLMPNTQYSVRIAAETSPGTGPYTALLNFTTREEAPSEGPNIDSVNSITSTTFVVVWSATPESIHNGEITGYEVSVSEEQTGAIVYDKISDANETRITVRNLNEYTRYRVDVDAFNSFGSSPSTIISVETAQSEPSSPPLYISSIVNTTWIELNWFAPFEEDQNGIITGYVIHINEWTVTTNSTEYKFRNLEEASQFVIQIAAMTLIGKGPLSTALNLTTLPIASTAPPQDINASAIASSLIHVTWEPVPILEQNGMILRYTVYYWVRNSNHTLRIVSTNTSNQITLDSLEAHTVYEILVFAVNVIGNSPKSEIISIKTWEDIPSVPPGNFSVHILSPFSVTLTWIPVSPAERNGIIIHQTITYQGSKLDTDLHAININSTSTNFTFTDFYPSVTYNFSLHESTIVGNGPRSYSTIMMPEFNPTSPPEEIIITNIETGFHVIWNKLPLASRNGKILLYEISLTTVSNGSNDSVTMTYNSTHSEIELTNLTVYTLYSMKMRAMTSAGYGPYSEPLGALTAPGGLKCFGYFSLYERDPCQNGAVCNPKNTEEFTCGCVPGYDGVFCHNEINECISHECEYGTCIDQINDYTCNCYSGYSGRFCEVELNECSSEPCQNGGMCVDQINYYECFCTNGFLGPDCEYPNKCLENPCQHGTCRPIQDKYVCSCDHAYQGANCEVNINDCSDVVCENGGECLDGETKFDCTCHYGYKGRYCQYSSLELTCESETMSQIQWPATKYSKIFIMPCQYIDPSFVYGNATRKCSKLGIWESVQMIECIRTPFEVLSTHLHEYDDIFGESTQIDVHNITEVVRNTAHIMCGRSIMSPQEIMLSLNLTEYALNSINDLNNENKLNIFSALVDRFLCIFSAIASSRNVEFFYGNYQKMTTSLYNTLKLFVTMSAQTLIKTPFNACSSILNDKIQLTVKEIDMKVNSTDFEVISDCKQTNTSYEGNNILLPSSLINALFDNNAHLGISVLYSNILGQILTSSSTGSFGKSEPTSTLAMVELATDLPNQLRDPIHLNFSILNTKTSNYNAYCVHWDTETQEWSEQGLSVYERNNDSITCSSTHLSTFIVLSVTIAESNPVERILTYIIYSVCGISLLSLIVALVLIISLGRKLAQSDIYIAQFSLGFAITLSVISHVVGLLSYAPIQDHCNVVAEIVYYLSLASITCFLAEGAAICFRFVLIKVKKRIHLGLITLGWIVPIPLAVFRIVSDMNDLGIKDKYCWLSIHHSIIWSMTEPVLIIFFITLICMLVSLVTWCSFRSVEQVRVARYALSGHIMLAPFILAPWVVTIVNMYVAVSYYRWAYPSLIAFQGILFLILYAIRNKTIRSQLRICKNCKPKYGEIGQEPVLELPYTSKSFDKAIPIYDTIVFPNAIYDDVIMKNPIEGAAPYPNEELLEVSKKELEVGYNTVSENEYAELNFLESKIDSPFTSEMPEIFDNIDKECIMEHLFLSSDDIFSEIENRYGPSPTRTIKQQPGDSVITYEEICGGSDNISIDVLGGVVITNEKICGNNVELSIEAPDVVIAKEEICGDSDSLSIISDKAELMKDPASSKV